ncbi:TPA: fimbrial protein [Providencia alcalifaciens]
MKTNLYLYFLLFFCSFSAISKDDFNIDLGTISIESSQVINNVFFTKDIFIPLACDDDCKSYRLNIIPISPISEKNNSGEYYFSSGIDGISLKIKKRLHKINNDGINLQLSLISSRAISKFNKTSISRPLFNWSMEKKGEDNNWVTKYTGVIFVNGKLEAGGCEAFGDMDFTLPNIDTSNVKKSLQLSSEMDTKVISIKCAPGSSSLAEISFYGEHFHSYPYVLKTSNGIGFVIKNNITNAYADWSGNEKINVKLSNDGITNVSFYAHYVRMSEKLIVGRVKAIASMVINYK